MAAAAAVIAACSGGAVRRDAPAFNCPTGCELRRPQIVCVNPGESLCVCLHDLVPLPAGCEESEGLEESWPYRPGYCCVATR